MTLILQNVQIHRNNPILLHSEFRTSNIVPLLYPYISALVFVFSSPLFPSWVSSFCFGFNCRWLEKVGPWVNNFQNVQHLGTSDRESFSW